MADDDFFASLDNKAKENLERIFRTVHHDGIRKPEIFNIYFRQHTLLQNHVPPDLQLPVLFENWNVIAAHGAVAKQDAREQDITITRLIWHYGLGNYYCFTRYRRDIRYNIMLMAYAWIMEFDHSICDPAVAEFVIGFVEAWLELMLDGPDPSANEFTARDKFINLWRASNFDLIRFTQYQLKKINSLVRSIRDRPVPRKILADLDRETEDFMSRRREGKISREEFARYGPTLVFKWTLKMAERGDRFAGASGKMAALKAQMQEAADQSRINRTLSTVPWESDVVGRLLMANEEVSKASKPTSQRPGWMQMDKVFEILEGDEDSLTMAMEAHTLCEPVEDKEEDGGLVVFT